jgi:hypothetical protein
MTALTRRRTLAAAASMGIGNGWREDEGQREQENELFHK